MKILFDCTLPFALAHGGHAIQIQQTMAALQGIGVAVEPMRWWDEHQSGDVIHYFGQMPCEQIQFAHAKKMAVVQTNLFTATCNRTDSDLYRRGLILKAMRRLPFGKRLAQGMNLDSYAVCDQNIVGIEAERRVLELIYGQPRGRTTVVPLGLEQVYLNAGPSDRSQNHLVCAGTITQRKNCVPLAQLAHKAQVPVLFVGKPYSENDPYWLEFRRLIDGRWVQYQSHVDHPADMVALLRRARGAVVMSQYENWCFTAHEAAACGLPLLLPPMKWSLERFGEQARYLENVAFNQRNVELLKQFHDDARALPPPGIKLYSWEEVALQLKAVYTSVLK